MRVNEHRLKPQHRHVYQLRRISADCVNGTAEVIWRARCVCVSYEEDERRAANQSHGGGEFALVAAAVSSC